MIVISIDPSMSNTALIAFRYDPVARTAVAIDSITLRTEKTSSKQVRASSDLIQRCGHLYAEAHAFIRKHAPDLVFAETPSGSQSASGMKNYGVSCFLLSTLTPKPIEVTPHEVKIATVGKKTATKVEMIDWAFSRHPEINWKLTPAKRPQVTTEEHLADAVGVLYAGLRTAEFSRAVAVLANATRRA